MASKTKLTETRRAMKKVGLGRWRKNQTQNQGSTAPLLKLDRPNANEKAQKAARA